MWLGLTLTSPALAFMDRFVATNGSDDSGTGAQAAPFQTIARALSSAQPGDRVILRGGTYCESVRILQPDITLMSADNEWAVIRWNFGPADSPEVAVRFDVDSDGGVLRRVEVVGGYYGVMIQTRFDWGEADRSGASDILIEDCKIHDTGRDCIKVTPNCDRITIRGCEIYNSGQLYPPGTPFDNKNAEGVDNVNADDMLVQDCYVHDTATTGVYFKGGARNCVVERCRIERCGHGGVLLGFDTSPEFFDLGVNPNYYEAINCTVRNCIIRDTGYEGIGFFAADGAIAANNTVVDTAKVGHNPIYFGVTLQDYVPEARRPASRNVQVLNNIVVQTMPMTQPMVFIRYLEEEGLAPIPSLAGFPTMDGNIYLTPDLGPTFTDSRPGSPLNNASLAVWRTHINGERNSVIADPMLTGDLHLKSGSPAIDRGVSVSGLVDDFDMDARSGALDVGADEFTSISPVVPTFGIPGTTIGDCGAASGPLAPTPNPGGSGGGSTSNPGGETRDGSGSGSTPSGGTTQGGGSIDNGEPDPNTPIGGACPMSAAALLAMSLVGLWSCPRRS